MTLRIEIDPQTPHTHVLACVRALTAYAGLTEGVLATVTGDGEGEPLRTIVEGGAIVPKTYDSAAVPVPPVPAAPSAPAPTPAAAAQPSTAHVDTSGFSTGSVNVPTPPAPTAGTPAVPSAPAATTNLAAGVEVDSRGFPWNERIHASTKSRNDDGTWRQMRNIEKKSPGLVAQVEAEMRAQGYLEPVPNAGTPAAPTPPVPQPPAAAPAVPAPPVPQAPTVPTPPAPPVPQPPAAAAPADSLVNPTTFIGMITRITELQKQGLIEQDEVEQCCKAVGVPALLHLGPIAQMDATVIPRLNAEIDRVMAS